MNSINHYNNGNQTHFVRAILYESKRLDLYAWNRHQKHIKFNVSVWAARWNTSAIAALHDVQNFIVKQPDPERGSKLYIPDPPWNALACVDMVRDDKNKQYIISSAAPFPTHMCVVVDPESVVRTEFEENNGVCTPITHVNTIPKHIREAAIECAATVLFTAVYKNVHDFTAHDIYFDKQYSAT